MNFGKKAEFLNTKHTHTCQNTTDTRFKEKTIELDVLELINNDLVAYTWTFLLLLLYFFLYARPGGANETHRVKATVQFDKFDESSSTDKKKRKFERFQPLSVRDEMRGKQQDTNAISALQKRAFSTLSALSTLPN